MHVETVGIDAAHIHVKIFHVSKIEEQDVQQRDSSLDHQVDVNEMQDRINGRTFFFLR